MTKLCNNGLTRGTVVVVVSDMLSSVMLVSLTLSTDGCLWKRFLVLKSKYKICTSYVWNNIHMESLSHRNIKGQVPKEDLYRL